MSARKDLTENLIGAERAKHAGDTAVVAFANWVIRFRWIILLFSFIGAMAAGFGGQYLDFSTNYRVFFSKDNPQLQAFETMQDTYIREDNISIVLHPDDGDVFTPELLAAVRDLTDKAWQIPYTTRVDSLTNFQNSYASGEDDLVVEDLVPVDTPLDAADIARIRETALAEPLIVERLISPDADTVSVNVIVP